MTAQCWGEGMELLDIYDKNGRPAGRTVERSVAFEHINREKERFLLVHVCVFNQKNEILLQRRQLTKDRYPGMWEVSAGGFVSAGEDSAGAVRRELQEEIGICSGEFSFVCREPFSFVLDDFYAAFLDPKLSDLTLQEEEVMGVEWFCRTDVLTMLRNGTMVDYPEDLMQRMFDYAEAHRQGRRCSK